MKANYKQKKEDDLSSSDHDADEEMDEFELTEMKKYSLFFNN